MLKFLLFGYLLAEMTYGFKTGKNIFPGKDNWRDVANYRPGPPRISRKTLSQVDLFDEDLSYNELISIVLAKQMEHDLNQDHQDNVFFKLLSIQDSNCEMDKETCSVNVVFHVGQCDTAGSVENVCATVKQKSLFCGTCFDMTSLDYVTPIECADKIPKSTISSRRFIVPRPSRGPIEPEENKRWGIASSMPHPLVDRNYDNSLAERNWGVTSSKPHPFSTRNFEDSKLSLADRNWGVTSSKPHPFSERNLKAGFPLADRSWGGLGFLQSTDQRLNNKWGTGTGKVHPLGE